MYAVLSSLKRKFKHCGTGVMEHCGTGVTEHCGMGVTEHCGTEERERRDKTSELLHL